MKIKKKLLTTVLFGCALSGSALAEKVTYEKAVADSKAYQDSLPHYENETIGLRPDETGGESSANKMGKWVNLGTSSIKNAGQHSSILTPNALGQSCVKGSKGWISKMESVCVSASASGFCRIPIEILDVNNGYKVECR